jgi:mono/diheme cytochrome c family protein
VYTTAPYYRERKLWAEHCAGCHTGDERKGPEIGPGYNSREWIRGFLLDPSHDRYFGRTKLAKTDEAMPATEASGEELDALVEMVYAETGATDVNRALATRGRTVFDEGPCSDCHERTGEESSSGPNLAGRGSIAYTRALIADAGQPRFFGGHNEMPVFRDELSPDDIARLASWTVWMRTATAADVQRLDE